MKQLTIVILALLIISCGTVHKSKTWDKQQKDSSYKEISSSQAGIIQHEKKQIESNDDYSEVTITTNPNTAVQWPETLEMSDSGNNILLIDSIAHYPISNNYQKLVTKYLKQLPPGSSVTFKKGKENTNTTETKDVLDTSKSQLEIVADTHEIQDKGAGTKTAIRPPWLAIIYITLLGGLVIFLWIKKPKKIN